MHVKTFAGIAVAQALLLFVALPAKADIKFSVDESLSYMTFTQTIDLSVIASGVHTTVPQYPDPDGAGPILGSDTASIFGAIYANLTPGFIELLPGHQVTWRRNRNTPGLGGVPGAFSPFDPVYSDPLGIPGGTTSNANFGVMATTGISTFLNLFQVMHGLHGDWGTTNPGPRPLTGTSFDYSPGDDFLIAAGGRSAFTSLLGEDTRSLVGEPLVVFGSAGLAKPSWDPAAGINGILTLPIESSFSAPLDLGHIVPGAVGTVTFTSFGMIIAAVPAPEPSSMVLLGFAVVGLLTYCWRLRRQKL